jgi:hypothetical protein
MTFDLGDGRQVVVANGRLMLWANRGCLGVQMTLEQQEELGLTMWAMARKARRSSAVTETRSAETRSKAQPEG